MAAIKYNIIYLVFNILQFCRLFYYEMNDNNALQFTLHEL